jgi:hypothetical protein
VILKVVNIVEVNAKDMGSTFGKNENSTESPTEALISLGVYMSPPCPTATEIVVAALATVAAVRKLIVEKCIMLVMRYNMCESLR